MIFPRRWVPGRVPVTDAPASGRVTGKASPAAFRVTAYVLGRPAIPAVFWVRKQLCKGALLAVFVSTPAFLAQSHQGNRRLYSGLGAIMRFLGSPRRRAW